MNLLRQALRELVKSPGFTVVAVLTLALGFGANVAFFSVLYGVVLQDPPYPQADRLFEVRNLAGPGANNDGRLALAEFFDYRARQNSLSGIGGSISGRATLTAGDGADRVKLTRITANLFPLLGVAPARGRNITETEEHTGRDDVVLVGHDFWQTKLGGRADVLEQTLRLNGVPHPIIGVMPPGFSYGEAGTGLWKPLNLDSQGAADREDHSLTAVARIAPGVSRDQAEDDLSRVLGQLQVDQPAHYPADPQTGIGLQSLRDSQYGHMRAPLGLLLLAASAVLLVACVNVAIMFLLRAATRHREMMIRLALGAAKRHIVQQSLADAAVVCGLGAVGGVLLASFGVQAIKAFAPGDIPRLSEVGIHAPVALFAGAMLVLVTLAVGLTPAWAVLKTRIYEGLIHSARSTESRAAVRLRDSLTVVEVALSVMLLVAAGLTLRSLQGLLQVDLGFATTRIFSFKTNLTNEAYPDLASANRLYDRLTESLETVPGVLSVGGVSYLPLSGEADVNFARLAADTAPAANAAATIPVGWRVTRGDYFPTMGVTLLGGRWFAPTDRIDTPRVTIVDDAFARRFWTNEAAALGQQIVYDGTRSDEPWTIIGVIRRVKHFGPAAETLPEVYVPQEQVYQRGMYTVLKTATAPETLAAQVRSRIAALDPTIPMYFTATVEQRYDDAVALPRFTAGLTSAFSTLALLLAGVGMFGVTAYSVARRTREFGIRFALGAQRSHVVAQVFKRVGRLLGLGIVIGVGAAFWLTQLMRSLLFEVSPDDPGTMLAAVVIIAVTVVVACLPPLRRAMRVHPAEILRSE